MKIEKLIKKLTEIKEEEGNIEFDVVLTDGDNVTLGFLKGKDEEELCQN